MRNSPGPTSDPRGLPARAGHGPDASPRDTLIRATLPAASPQALRALHSHHQTPLSHAPSLSSTASHPRVGSGNVSRPLLRVGPAIPPPSPITPHSGTRVSLPSHWPLRGQRLRRKRLRRGAFGARLRRISVPPDLSGPLAGCTFPFPPFRFCSLFQRVALPNRLASSRRG